MSTILPGVTGSFSTSSRRNFIKAGLLAGVALAVPFVRLPSALADGAATLTAPADFIVASEILTGHKLEASLADRAWSALVLREKDFVSRYQTLTRAMDAAGFKDMTAWSGFSAGLDAPASSAAVAVVSAWYLGVVGPVDDSGENGPSFITYENALMWQPTIDVTVVPSYSKQGPGWWGTVPSTLATD